MMNVMLIVIPMVRDLFKQASSFCVLLDRIKNYL